MQSHRSALLAVGLSAVFAAGCEKSGSSPTTAPASDAAAATDVEPTAADSQSLLQPVQGTWVGQYKLNWMDPAKSEFLEEVSDGTATVTGDRIEYTWGFRGDPQSGTIDLSRVDAGVETRFVDTWHTPDGKALVSTGTVDNDLINVLGSYGGGGGPDWGWRTEVEVADPSAFVLRMYNITPDGQEVIAVDFACKRSTQPAPD